MESSFRNQQQIYESGRQPTGQPRRLDTDELFDAAMNANGAPHCERPPIAYVNPASGWAWSRGAMDHMYQKCRMAGVSFATAQITSLIIEDGDVKGARTADGKQYRAKLTMLAAGSWCTSIFPELKGKVDATGQVVAMVQLTAEEAKRYAGIVSNHWPTI